MSLRIEDIVSMYDVYDNVDDDVDEYDRWCRENESRGIHYAPIIDSARDDDLPEDGHRRSSARYEPKRPYFHNPFEGVKVTTITEQELLEMIPCPPHMPEESWNGFLKNAHYQLKNTDFFTATPFTRNLTFCTAGDFVFLPDWGCEMKFSRNVETENSVRFQLFMLAYYKMVKNWYDNLSSKLGDDDIAQCYECESHIEGAIRIAKNLLQSCVMFIRRTGKDVITIAPNSSSDITMVMSSDIDPTLPWSVCASYLHLPFTNRQ